MIRRARTSAGLLACVLASSAWLQAQDPIASESPSIRWIELPTEVTFGENFRATLELGWPDSIEPSIPVAATLGPDLLSLESKAQPTDGGVLSTLLICEFRATSIDSFDLPRPTLRWIADSRPYSIRCEESSVAVRSALSATERESIASSANTSLESRPDISGASIPIDEIMIRQLVILVAFGLFGSLAWSLRRRLRAKSREPEPTPTLEQLAESAPSERALQALANAIRSSAAAESPSDRTSLTVLFEQGASDPNGRQLLEIGRDLERVRYGSRSVTPEQVKPLVARFREWQATSPGGLG